MKEVLVVGCRSGLEAAILAQGLNANVVGIDLNPDFDAETSRIAELRNGDATTPEFANASFDLVYLYHALEHTPNFRKALENRCVVFLQTTVGTAWETPNRSRALGYLGAGQTTLAEKVWWNAEDWKARLTGRFRNELGAHAGFTRNELASELRRCSLKSTHYFGDDLSEAREAAARNQQAEHREAFFPHPYTSLGGSSLILATLVLRECSRHSKQHSTAFGRRVTRTYNNGQSFIPTPFLCRPSVAGHLFASGALECGTA